MALDLSRKWDEYRPSKMQAFWFGAGCVAATLVLGFGISGWVSAGTAEKLRTEASENARQELAAAICVDEFMQAKDAGGRLEKLKTAGWYERTEQVESGGWATMPDRKEPNRTVAIMCSSQLAEMEATAAPASTAKAM
jgi:hypothetical protein